MPLTQKQFEDTAPLLVELLSPDWEVHTLDTGLLFTGSRPQICLRSRAFSRRCSSSPTGTATIGDSPTRSRSGTPDLCCGDLDDNASDYHTDNLQETKEHDEGRLELHQQTSNQVRCTVGKHSQAASIPL